MVPVSDQLRRRPLGLVVCGDAVRHNEAIEKLLGPVVVMHVAGDRRELLDIIRASRVDAVVLDSQACLPDRQVEDDQDVLKTLRMLRRIDAVLPVILVARQMSRRLMEDALRLAVFSVVHKPLQREQLLIQLRRIMERHRIW